jgi:hypothetical protein
MKPFIIPIVLFIVVFVIAELLRKESTSEFKKIQTLLTPAELTFYKFLLNNLPPGISVMCKVRLADILKPVSSGKTYMTDFNKIKSKHIDFVLVNSETLEIKTLIELNDKSHFKSERITRDSFLEKTFKDVNLNYFTVRVKYKYNKEDIQPIIESIKISE